MTGDEAELMQKLAMYLDVCLDLVAAEARKEKRAGHGMSLRQVTWQGRAKHFPEVVNDARMMLDAAGYHVYF